MAEVEVAIVGGGLAGSALAAVLARQGRSVTLIDPRRQPAPEFRAEKLTGRQVVALRRLGLAAPVLAAATPIDRLRIVRRGRLVEERDNDEWGLDYGTLVGALRAQVPEAALRIGRAASLAADADGASVTLAGGDVVRARLAVLASGLGRTMLADLGIERRETAHDHSMAIGFDLVPAAAADPCVPLTLFGHGPADRIAYLTLFPIGRRLRANLFTFHRRDDPWLERLRADPLGVLVASLPGLAAMLPPIAETTAPVIRPIHLYQSAGHLRPGVTLVGDAFATTCPTGGTGLSKTLNDVERLAGLIPGWLATRGLGREKIAAFYDDPAKRAGDATARAMVRHARAAALDRGPYWTLRRQVGPHLQRLRAAMRRRAGERAATALTGAPGAAHL